MEHRSVRSGESGVGRGVGVGKKVCWSQLDPTMRAGGEWSSSFPLPTQQHEALRRWGDGGEACDEGLAVAIPNVGEKQENLAALQDRLTSRRSRRSSVGNDETRGRWAGNESHRLLTCGLTGSCYRAGWQPSARLVFQSLAWRPGDTNSPTDYLHHCYITYLSDISASATCNVLVSPCAMSLRCVCTCGCGAPTLVIP